MGTHEGGWGIGSVPSHLSGNPDYEPALKKLIKNYHMTDNSLGYYLADLPKIAEKQGNSEKVVERTLDILVEVGIKSKSPLFVSRWILAAAYWQAGFELGEPRHMVKIAHEFGARPSDMKQGIKNLTHCRATYGRT